jgi:hypothetical protein
MRKLTVKNFSVIKDAELEFGKITVLIGPQASGKSLLCKLAYFLDRKVLEIAIERAVNRFEYGFSDFEAAVQKEFSKWFPRGGWGSEIWSIAFSANEFEVTVSAPLTSEPDSEASLIFNEAFRSAYVTRIEATIEKQRKGEFLLGPALQSLAATEFREIAGRGVWDSSTYIPLERSYFVDTKKGYRVLATEAEPLSAHFAEVFANSMNPGSLKPRVTKYLRGNIISSQEGWMLAFHDGRYLPLSHISSGSKETLPILAALDYYEHQRRQSGHLPSQELYGHRLYSFDDFTIEEPEASVFPQTQYALVREFAALANEVDFRPRFTITTHSPYILTAFNDLIKAGHIVAQRPDKAAEIEKIVPSQYWIKPGDFAAYAFDGKDGVLRSIVDDETKMINGDVLDDISETISEEFGQLLEIQYGD